MRRLRAASADRVPRLCSPSSQLLDVDFQPHPGLVATRCAQHTRQRHLPPGHRQLRDHQHRPRTALAEDLRQRRTAAEAIRAVCGRVGRASAGRPDTTPPVGDEQVYHHPCCSVLLFGRHGQGILRAVVAAGSCVERQPGPDCRVSDEAKEGARPRGVRCTWAGRDGLSRIRSSDGTIRAPVGSVLRGLCSRGRVLVSGGWSGSTGSSGWLSCGGGRVRRGGRRC
jgi:hypothetical protein